MFETWTRWRARTGLTAAGVTLSVLVAAAPAASAVAGQTAASGRGPVVGTTNGPVRGRPRRGRHRCHLRVPRAGHRSVRLAVRAGLRLRVQRRERTGEL